MLTTGFISHGLEYYFQWKTVLASLMLDNIILFIHIESTFTFPSCIGDFSCTKRWIHQWITLFQSINRADIIMIVQLEITLRSKPSVFNVNITLGSKNLLIIKQSNIFVQNLITIFNCQSEITLDDKYGNHHTKYWYLTVYWKGKQTKTSSSEYVGHQGR